MQKTITISVSMVCATFLIAFGMHVYTRPNQERYSYTSDSDRHSIAEHHFTHCVKVVMSESRQSGKTIEAKDAAELCQNVNVKPGTKLHNPIQHDQPHHDTK